MNEPNFPRTARLVLRRWRPEDREPFADLNADPRVCEFLPKTLTREESDAAIARMEAHFDKHGFGLWAVELNESGQFAGFVGLTWPRFEGPMATRIEIGWRLAHEHWGKGYASEGARAALAYGFETLGLEEVVSFAVPTNARSIRVMEKLGMKRDLEGDFDHPLVPEGHPLRRHVLYRIQRPNG